MKISYVDMVLCCVLLSGCATAVSLPQHGEATNEAKEQGKMLLLSSIQKSDPQDIWSHSTFLKVVTKDIWQSQSARRATPIPEPSLQIQFAFDLTKDDAFMKFLEGKQHENIIGIENGTTYFVTRGKRQEKSSAAVDRYLPPVKNYFLWPQTLLRMENIVYLGEADHTERHYHQVLASNAEEHYIIWINDRTSHIDYIEFTVKKPRQSYRGVVQYREYRDVDGVLLPHDITLLDGIATEKYTHKFYAQIMTLQ